VKNFLPFLTIFAEPWAAARLLGPAAGLPAVYCLKELAAERKYDWRPRRTHNTERPGRRGPETLVPMFFHFSEVSLKGTSRYSNLVIENYGTT
jgi:hypothetical protein